MRNNFVKPKPTVYTLSYLYKDASQNWVPKTIHELTEEEATVFIKESSACFTTPTGRLLLRILGGNVKKMQLEKGAVAAPYVLK
jgi:hypothetical protein